MPAPRSTNAMSYPFTRNVGMCSYPGFHRWAPKPTPECFIAKGRYLTGRYLTLERLRFRCGRASLPRDNPATPYALKQPLAPCFFRR